MVARSRIGGVNASMFPTVLVDEPSRTTRDLRARWRAFGAPDDIDIDLQQLPRSTVVTSLLARCQVAVDGNGDVFADARRLTLSGRIGGLAAIVACTSSRAEIPLELRCPFEHCGEALSVELSLLQMIELSQQAEADRTIEVALPGSGSIHVRRPTGDDQNAWQFHEYPDAASADRAIAISLVAGRGGSSLSSSALLAIDVALEEADPLACFRVSVTCPGCAQESGHAVDLEELLLAYLRQVQRDLLRDVHHIASRYGWSERAIAAIPAWRRRVYLDWIEQEKP